MFQTKVVEEIKTHILCSIKFIFFFLENLAVYEIEKQTIVELDSPPTTIWPMCVACFIPKATDSHSEFVILIDFRL